MALYTFKDTINSTVSKELKPREAVQFNGHWLDEDIYSEGNYQFRTLNVSGRELLSSSVDTFGIGNTMGEYFRERKYGPRTIIVTFRIIASSAKTFRAAFNKLNRYLRPEQKKLIFNDEPGKYFIASVTDVKTPEPGRNSVTGEIHFFCADPRKYAVQTKTFTAVWDKNKSALVAEVKNSGNVPVPISYEVTNNLENGFIGIVSSKGTMQYGLKSDTNYETGTKSIWYINANRGKAIADISSSDTYISSVSNALPAAGCLNSDVYAGGTWQVVTNSDGGIANETFLELATLPSSHTDQWHGAAKTFVLTNGCQHFHCRFRLWLQVGDIYETGVFWVAMLDANNNNVCDMFVVKSQHSDPKADVHMRVGMKDKAIVGVDLGASGKNFPFGNTLGKCYIDKNGKTFTFTISGEQYTYNVSTYKNTEIKKIVLYEGIYGPLPITPWANRWKNWIARDYFREFKFRRDQVEYRRNVPNRFPAGSVLNINGNSGKVTLDGKLAHNDEVIGTKYFKAPHGTLQIQIIPSMGGDWPSASDSKRISATATIREAWI